MKHTSLILMLAACTLAASAQTPAPAAPAAKQAVAAKTSAKPATAVAKSSATPAKPDATAAKPAPAVKLSLGVPAPGIPPVKAFKKTIFTAAVQYQEIKIGTGPVVEPNKLYKVLYTGWLGANGREDDGRKFDSTDDHPRPPVLDKDGKPVLGDDGKPKQGPPQPIPFPQGTGGTIIGFDQGFAGMRVGGQRRIFIPWQMGYGTRTLPDRGPNHLGIPAKSDLIFDVELVEMTDIPAQQARPGMMPGMRPGAGGQQIPPRPGAPTQMMTMPKPAAPPAPGTTPNAAAPATPAPPATVPAATTPAVAPTK